MFDIDSVMLSLSKKRPVFRSEKDLQDALHTHLSSVVDQCIKNKYIHGIKVDIWLEHNGQEIVIQLRHKTKKLSVEVKGEKFDLKNHGAQDISRYDYLKDVQSIERLCLDNPFRIGYAILLTNDHLYWQKPVKSRSVDEDFLIFEGNSLSGECGWKEEAGFGTTNGREEPIHLKNEYMMRWKTYSTFPVYDSEFRYLCLNVIGG